MTSVSSSYILRWNLNLPSWPLTSKCMGRPSSLTQMTKLVKFELSRTRKAPCTSAHTSRSHSARGSGPAYHGCRVCLKPGLLPRRREFDDLDDRRDNGRLACAARSGDNTAGDSPSACAPGSPPESGSWARGWAGAVCVLAEPPALTGGKPKSSTGGGRLGSAWGICTNRQRSRHSAATGRIPFTDSNPNQSRSPTFLEPIRTCPASGMYNDATASPLSKTVTPGSSCSSKSDHNHREGGVRVTGTCDGGIAVRAAVCSPRERCRCGTTLGSEAKPKQRGWGRIPAATWRSAQGL